MLDLAHIQIPYEPTQLESIVMIAVDWFHMISILAFLIAICWTKDCGGISGKSQLLYAMVFIIRFQKETWNPFFIYHVIMKVAYTSITCFTVLLVFYFYKETYNEKDDNFCIRRLIFPCIFVALVMGYDYDVIEILRTLSIYLEMVAMVPQIYFVEKTKRFDKIVGLYMGALFLSKAVYVHFTIFNMTESSCQNKITICCGAIQALLTFDFFVSQFHSYYLKRSEKPAPQLDAVCLNNEVIIIADPTDQTKSASNQNKLYSIVLTPETLLQEDKINLLPEKENITKY